MSKLTDIIGLVRTGGQTGVDQGAWDSAVAKGVAYGGYVPAGRKDERGIIPLSYKSDKIVPLTWRLRTSGGYADRTVKNVRAAEAVLIFSCGTTPGTDLTRRLVPHETCLYEQSLVGCDFADIKDIATRMAPRLAPWIADMGAFAGHPIDLMVAGPRESKAPGIQKVVAAILSRTFEELT